MGRKTTSRPPPVMLTRDARSRAAGRPNGAVSLDGGLATGLDGKSLSASRGGEFTRLEALPYPWSDRDGLANVLDDADLWSRIIGDLELRRIILHVSPSSKVGRGLGRRPRASDGDEFGRALVALLADSGQRVAASERLRRELTKRRSPAAIGVPDLLAEAIVLWLSQRGAEGPSARFFPEAITPTIQGSGLDATRFAQVLGEGGSPSLEVALMACAQAMFRPGEAPRFAAVLLACTPRYERFVVEYGRSTDAAEDGQLEGGTQRVPPEVTTVLRQGQRESRRPSHAPPRATPSEVRAVEARGLAAVATSQARTEEPAVKEDPDHALRAAIGAVAAELDAPALFGALSHVLIDAGLDGVAAHQGLRGSRRGARGGAGRIARAASDARGVDRRARARDDEPGGPPPPARRRRGVLRRAP